MALRTDSKVAKWTSGPRAFPDSDYCYLGPFLWTEVSLEVTSKMH